MKIIKYTLFTLIFGLFLSVLPLQAVIVEGEQGILGNKTITLLSDIPFKNREINDQQRKDFIENITNKENTLVITTDLLDISGMPSETGDPYEVEEEELISRDTIAQCMISEYGHLATETFTCSLTKLCHNNNIEVSNQEFRQAQWISANSDQLSALQSALITKNIINEIDNYTEPSQFMSFYSEIYNKPLQINSALQDTLKDKPYSIRQIMALPNLTKEITTVLYNASVMVEIPANFRSLSDSEKKDISTLVTNKYIRQNYHDSLIIPRILYAIYAAQKSNIIVCANKQDIDQLVRYLETDRYQKNRKVIIGSGHFSSITSELSSFMQQTQPIPHIGVPLLPTHTTTPVSFRSGIPRWLKIGFGVALGTALAYTLYKHFFKSQS